MTPDNTPEWMKDRSALWNAVEKIETHSKAQLSREIEFSVPYEIEHKHRRAEALAFVQEDFVSQGMIADVSFHAPRPEKGEDPRNYHVHVMLTMRELTSEGFHPKKSTPKARSWNNRDNIPAWYKAWADRQNAALEKHGHDVRVSHLSLKAQGIDRVPQKHLGKAANQALKRGGEHPRIKRMKVIQRRNDRIDRVRKGRLKQVGDMRREVAQLHREMRKAGLARWVSVLTGKRKATEKRIEEIVSERGRRLATANALRRQQIELLSKSLMLMRADHERTKKLSKAVATARIARKNEQRVKQDQKAAQHQKVMERQKQQAANDAQQSPERSKSDTPKVRKPKFAHRAQGEFAAQSQPEKSEPRKPLSPEKRRERSRNRRGRDSGR